MYSISNWVVGSLRVISYPLIPYADSASSIAGLTREVAVWRCDQRRNVRMKIDST